MHRLVKYAPMIACVLVGVATTAAAQERALIGSKSANPILLVARDRDGNPVEDLKPEDVTVIDNGQPATVLGLERADKIPLRIGILLVGEQTTFKAQQEAAIQLLGNLRPGTDQAFVLTQATTIKPRPWPNQKLIWDPDPKALTSFVRGLHWNEAMTSTKDVVMQMLALNPSKPFRRVMLEFRDPGLETGVDYRTMPYAELDALLALEISEYQRRNIIVYTSTIAGPLGYPINYQPGSVKIERIAVTTGGRHLGWNKLQSEVAGMQKDLQNQLLLTFSSEPDNQGQQPHTLEIRVSRKDVRIAAPRQFYPQGSTAR